MRLRHGLLFAALALVLGAAGGAHASAVPFTGTLSIQVGSLEPFEVQGGGTADVNGTAGTGPLTQLTIPAGAFATSVTKTWTLSGAKLKVSASLSHNSILLQDPGTCTADHPGVSCPGGGLAGFGGLQAQLVVSTSSQIVNLTVPITPIGGGSTTRSSVISGYSIYLSGAGWTTGAVTAGGTTVATGSGTASAAATNSLTLVTPFQVGITGVGSLPSFAQISLHFVPEPGTLLLLGSGVAGLLVYGRRRMRQ